MLTNFRSIAKSCKPLSETIAIPDYTAFRFSLSRAKEPKWLLDQDMPTLFYVAVQYKIKTELGVNKHPYIQMLKDLEAFNSAEDYGAPYEKSTVLATLASIDEISVAEYMFDLFSRFRQINKLDAININGKYDSDIPVIEAVKAKNLNSIYTLIMFGADPNKPTHIHANTALHYACEAHSLQVISALVGQGANPQLLNTAGKKPIDMVEDLEVQKKVLQAIKEGCNIKNRLKAKG